MSRWLVWLPVLLLGCSGEHRPAVPEGPEAWVEHAPRHARSFTLLRSGVRRRLLVFGDQGRQDTLAVIDLSSGSSKAVRSASRFPLTVPLRRVALLSTTHASYLSAIGAAERIRSMAYLGKYYAHRIRGATELALFRKNQKADHRSRAVDEMTQAASYWDRYTSTALEQYTNPIDLNRVILVDWQALRKEVQKDIAMAGADLP